MEYWVKCIRTETQHSITPILQAFQFFEDEDEDEEAGHFALRTEGRADLL